jgi:hypothetical protein
VKGVSPTTSNAILQKVHHVCEDARKGNNYNLDQLNATLKDFDEDGDPDNNSDEMDDNNFDVRDACGKVLALVKQV